MSTVFNFTFVPWFRSVAPYIHMHRGKTFVVGISGEAIAAGKLHNLAQDLALIQSMGVKIVLVHGFRPQVNEQLAAKGHTPQYSHGIRITDSVALDCAQEAAGQLRYEIEAAFSQGLPNTPMAGSTVRVISGNFITARPVGIVDGVDFIHSGLVRKVDVDGIMRTLDMGAMVLLSPFGFSPTGEAFNLAMEEVATSVATELQADKLIFVTEIPGIRIEPHAPASEDNPIDTELPLAAAKQLLASGSVNYENVDAPAGTTAVVKVGDVVCCYGRCLKIGRSSMRLKLEVWVKPVLRENEAQRYCVTEGVFTYVAIDENRKPRALPGKE